MEFRSALEESLQKREITDELLERLEKSKEKSEELKKDLKERDRNIISIKLYSAARTCEESLDASLNELMRARSHGENPTTLENLSSLLFYVDELLRETDEITNNSANGYIKILRKNTFNVQEEAERQGIIDNIENRARGTSKWDDVVSIIEENTQ